VNITFTEYNTISVQYNDYSYIFTKGWHDKEVLNDYYGDWKGMLSDQTEYMSEYPALNNEEVSFNEEMYASDKENEQLVMYDGSILCVFVDMAYYKPYSQMSWKGKCYEIEDNKYILHWSDYYNKDTGASYTYYYREDDTTTDNIVTAAKEYDAAVKTLSTASTPMTATGVTLECIDDDDIPEAVFTCVYGTSVKSSSIL
jgi:hypothetical protein